MNTISVLITDAQKSRNDEYKNGLAKLGNYRVWQALTLLESREILSSRNVDYMILDLGLSENSSEEFVKEMASKRGWTTKIIIMNADEDAKIIEELFRYGIVDHFLKNNPVYRVCRDIHQLILNIEQNYDSTVLVVDDSRSINALLVDVLERRNFKVLSAMDGGEALEILENNDIDILLLDLEMPKVNGEKVLSELQKIEHCSSLPVIVLSGTSNSELIAYVMKHGAHDFIKKPFSVEVVYWKVDIFLRLSRAEKLLKATNAELEERVEKEISKRMDQEQMLIQQSKMAGMGEMIGVIAHQWKQPINALYLTIQNLYESYQFNEMTPEMMQQTMDKTTELVKFMSQTVDDFRNFLRPSKEKMDFEVEDSIRKVLNILYSTLMDKSIRINLQNKAEKSLRVNGYKNEFEQVILNIINNAKDAILEQVEKGKIAPEKGLITIRIDKALDNVLIFVDDNGGGIPDHVIGHVFDSYFTTKPDEKGTGIGLYMAKTIIEKNMSGKLSVRNRDDGAEFIIEMKTVD